MHEHRQVIEDLIFDCAHCIDDDRLEQWPEFFTDDARYLLTTRENHDAGLPAGIMICTSRGMMRDRILAYRGANIYEPHRYRHLVSAPRIQGVMNGVHAVQTSFAVIRIMEEGEMSIFAAGRYLDDIVIENGRARFKNRVVVLDSNRVHTLIVIPL